jgi:hypothetical protein
VFVAVGVRDGLGVRLGVAVSLAVSDGVTVAVAVAAAVVVAVAVSGVDVFSGIITAASPTTVFAIAVCTADSDGAQEEMSTIKRHNAPKDCATGAEQGHGSELSILTVAAQFATEP